ncbi:SRPBCC family protein [Acrocarpospora macrocephala]|uniref:Activator of HSP90 ATPase n=1 Tax=Acrocarpospora macrocephala TaxID=150177 RepID=A0A5M3WE80_9ACTN|nr:SRPBCC family protein [Acrocarpospora macrocephala]GES07146.1 activator of HSP90 ATPase [Acrocarpospora macrocephala]
MTVYTLNPELDLVLERTVDVAPELVWKAWTTPELLKQWFAPRPWSTPFCEIDLRPGGRFNTTMRSPEGEEYPNSGCILLVEEGSTLIFTSGLGPGFRPQTTEGEADFPFTAVINIKPDGNGTKYTAIAMHADSSTRKTHEDMGFAEGWGMALDQLVELAKSL